MLRRADRYTGNPDTMGPNLRSRPRSGFQVLAHLAKQARGRLLPQMGRTVAELAPKGVAEVTVTGKAHRQSQLGEVGRSFGQPFQRPT